MAIFPAASSAVKAASLPKPLRFDCRRGLRRFHAADYDFSAGRRSRRYAAELSPMPISAITPTPFSRRPQYLLLLFRRAISILRRRDIGWSFSRVISSIAWPPFATPPSADSRQLFRLLHAASRSARPRLIAFAFR